MIRRHVPIKRSVVIRRPTKRKQGYDDPEFRSWLKSWPCWICFNRYCAEHGYDAKKERQRPEVRALAAVLICFDCGPTQVAHVGARGIGQRCADSMAIPLGQKHHLHPTAGGGPESHHGLGKKFWQFHNLDRLDIHVELHELYHKETGRAA